MKKRILALLMCTLLIFAVGCSDKETTSEPTSANSSSQVSSQVKEEPTVYMNALTGETNINSKEVANRRPVAIMVNNISVAQPVQAGLDKADIVYETEVEGGITRLLAVFQDITKAEKIGTVRSARYAYVDLAMGHNAIYVHHGEDKTYCTPHLKDVDRLVLGTSNGGIRVKNGLAQEHTLYAFGDKLWNNISKAHKTERKSDATWQNFADEKTNVTFTDTANSVSVPFSTSYKTVFKYDAEKGKYTRYFRDTLRKDSITGNTENFKNVFVLMTNISNYSDGYHKNIDLTKGEGYYCVNGTYTKINWSKGNASSGFVFTNLDGSPLTVNAGNSWVCIANKSSVPSFS